LLAKTFFLSPLTFGSPQVPSSQSSNAAVCAIFTFALVLMVFECIKSARSCQFREPIPVFCFPSSHSSLDVGC
jgi:hypothetical protein